MEAKLKLAFRNLFEKKLSKEKYTNNQIAAAQKALAKVREMREARMFNISLYKYKGDVKGIKVVAKNPKTPHISEPVEKIEAPMEKKEEMKQEENKEEEMMKKWVDELMKEIENKKQTKEETKAEWAFEQQLLEQKGKSKEEPEEPEEPEVIPEKSIPRKRPANRTTQKIKEPKLPKQVRPIPPRKPKIIQQKYLTPKPQSESVAPKLKKDYKNNKADRIKAIHKLIYDD